MDRRRGVGRELSREEVWRGLSELERERVRLILERVVSGETVVEVARELGLSESEVEGYLRLGLDGVVGRLSEYVEERLRVHLMRLDRLFHAVYPRALEGDMGAVKRALEILQRESMVLGLDAAQKRVIEHRLTAGERAGQMIFGVSGDGLERAGVAALPEWYIDAEWVEESSERVLDSESAVRNGFGDSGREGDGSELLNWGDGGSPVGFEGEMDSGLGVSRRRERRVRVVSSEAEEWGDGEFVSDEDE